MATASYGTVSRGDNPYVASLIYGDDKWDVSSGPITYSFQTQYGEHTTFPWLTYERDAFAKAATLYSNVAKISFQNVADNSDANLRFWSVNKEMMSYFEESPNGLGVQYGPDGSKYQGMGAYNWEAHDNWEGHSAQGGTSFWTILHEMGHGLGLKHPHDGVNGPLFPGITTHGDAAAQGENGLNSGLNTVMSYKQMGFWWSSATQSTTGFPGGPMALDIAALQKIYGANTSHKTGNDTYWLGADPFYTSIWDAGGTDSISFLGNKSATINLNPAPLTGRNAGGHLSYLGPADAGPGKPLTDLGGFTIANGVTIENAEGGSAADTITGNSAKNYLRGNSGDDSLFGVDGNDTLDGGFGYDKLDGGRGTDTVTYAFYANSDGMTVNLKSGRVSFKNDSRSDTLWDIENVIGGGGGDKIYGNSGVNRLEGGSGDDLIEGNGGKDTLVGGTGDDALWGSPGSGSKETFVFDTGIKAKGDVDTVKHYESKYDQIFLDDLYFKGLGQGKDSGRRIDKDMFAANTSGEAEIARKAQIVYETDTGKLYYDGDGKGGVKAVHFATFDKKPALTYGEFEII